MGLPGHAVQAEVEVIDRIDAIFLGKFVDLADDGAGIVAPGAAQQDQIVSLLLQQVDQLVIIQALEDDVLIFKGIDSVLTICVRIGLGIVFVVKILCLEIISRIGQIDSIADNLGNSYFRNFRGFRGFRCFCACRGGLTAAACKAAEYQNHCQQSGDHFL